MTIDGVSGRTSYLGSSIINIKNQLNDLTQQLASGKKSNTYAGLGVDSGTATGLRAQLSGIAAYANTATTLNTRINVANLSLQGIIDAGSEVKGAAAGATLTLDNGGKTAGQQTAMASFTQTIALLNADVDGRYLFSGRATDTPATQSADVILNGTGSQAGLKQVIDERRKADGAELGGTGRLVIDPAATPPAPPTSVSIGEDVAGSPFGLKLDSITSTANGSTVSGPAAPVSPPAPAGSPSVMSVDFGTTNPKNGDKVRFSFSLPDGTKEAIELTASNENPPPPGGFTIGTDPTATAANLKGALTTAVQTLSDSALVAASAMAAGNDFFGSPPMRVDPSVPPGSATALVAGTPANTVSWYTGESAQGSNDSARGTAVVAVDQSVSVQYGARANEDAFVTQLKNIAVYTAITTDASDPNANGQLTAMNARVIDNLAVHPGKQSIQDIQSEFAGVQSSIKTAKDRQTQTGAIAQSLLGSIEGISDDEVATKILALQTTLQASYQTTASLYQMSLLKFMPPP